MRALISVANKSGIVEFARELTKLGWEIVSTGGTASLLSQQGIPVTRVDEVTRHPEILGGRVKTLHPKIHGGILAKRGDNAHDDDLASSQITPVDLVVVNLYPFEQTVAKEHKLEEAIEHIDIGGVALLRAAAKNLAHVSVVSSPSQYEAVINELRVRPVSLDHRKKLAAQAFRITASYDAAIESYLHTSFLKNEVLHLRYDQGKKLRYGENWHQEAIFFKGEKSGACISNARQLHGKELSYNNLVDGDAALEALKEVGQSIAVCVVKHTNPCGLATGETLSKALEAAWSGDTTSAFGSVIACSRPVDLGAAEFLKGKFVEIIIAPGYNEDALEFLKAKSKNLRILEVEALDKETSQGKEYRYVNGGLLQQDRNGKLIDTWKCMTVEKFSDPLQGLAKFSVAATKHTKSNAVVLATEYEPGFYKVLGMGAGQPNRVDSLRKLAITKAQENTLAQFSAQDKEKNFDIYRKKVFESVVLASDAFFPFPDTVEAAAEYGIKYIVQPGGSIRDQEVIEACNKLGQVMIFTGVRHFRH